MFVSQQLGQPTPCLLHVSIVCEAESQSMLDVEPQPTPSADYDEPYEFGQARPTVDRPGPFRIRELVRLQLLRSRTQAEPSALDAPTRRSQARSLSRR
jgi:hypothetical protein